MYRTFLRTSRVLGVLVAQIRDSGFASITFNHKSKVGRVLLFIELAPQTVLRYATKPGCFVVRDCSGCDLSEQKQFFVVRKLSCCDHSQNKNGFLWSGSFALAVSFCGCPFQVPQQDRSPGKTNVAVGVLNHPHPVLFVFKLQRITPVLKSNVCKIPPLAIVEVDFLPLQQNKAPRQISLAKGFGGFFPKLLLVAS